MSDQNPPTFADLVSAATSSQSSEQTPPTASGGSFDDLVKAATSPKDQTQSPEKAPTNGVVAGPTGSDTAPVGSIYRVSNPSAPSDAAGDELAQGDRLEPALPNIPDITDVTPQERGVQQETRDIVQSIIKNEEEFAKRAATISKRDFIPQDQSQYVYLNGSRDNVTGIDPRDAKMEQDFWNYANATGERRTQMSREKQMQMREARAWTPKLDIQYQADVLNHQADILLGRQLRMEEAIANGADPQLFAQEKEDIRAGQELVSHKFFELGQRDPQTLMDKYRQRLQRETDIEGRGVFSDTFKRFRSGGRKFVGSVAQGALGILDPSGNYTLADRLGDAMAETEASMETDIASAHKGGVYSKAEGWRGKAALPMLGEGLANMIGFIGTSGVAGGIARAGTVGSAALKAAAASRAASGALIGTSFLQGYDQYIDDATAAGEKKENLDLPAKVYGGLYAAAERFINPQLWVARGPAAKSAFIETIKSGGTIREATKSFFRDGGREMTEEFAQNYSQAAVNLVANELAGTNLETGVDAETNINSAFGALLLGGLGGVGGNSNFGSSKLKQQAVVWAMNNPSEAKGLIERFVPKDQQKAFVDRLDSVTKTYVGNMLGGMSTEKAAKIVDLSQKKKKVEESLKQSPMDDALAQVMKDPRVEEREKLARDIMTEMGIDEAKQNDALVAAGIIKAPLDADGKEIKPKDIKKVAPPTVADEVSTGKTVDPDDDVEIDPVESDVTLDEAIASVSPSMSRSLDVEVNNAAKALSGMGVTVRVHDSGDSFAAAYSEAGGQQSIDGSLHEGFYDPASKTIHINRSLNREGLAAHEGTHALFISALASTDNGRAVLAEAARQVLNESPEVRSSIAKFLEGYGGAKRKADGSIDVEATAADNALAGEVFAEFVSSLANGTIKLNGGIRTFLKDMWNKVMATLGVSMKFDPKSDSDFIKLASDIASAMKTGRVIATNKANSPGVPVSSVRRASDLANEMDVAATQSEDEFFMVTWPNLLKKVGNVFKPTKAGFQAAAALAVNDVNEFIRDNPRYQDYYHKDLELTREMIKGAFPVVNERPELADVFHVISGFMSPHTFLKANMREAVAAFDHWLNKGSFDAIKIIPNGPMYKMGRSPFSIGSSTSVNKARSIKAFDSVIKKHGPKKAVDMLKEQVTLAELKEFNGSLGYAQLGDVGKIKNAVRAATGQDENIPRIFVFGPKVGAYTLNQLGDGRYTTVDIWESRFIKSYFHKMFQNSGGAITSSMGESDLFSEFSKRFAQEFKDRNGFSLDPSAYQAMRWYTMIDAAKKARYKYAFTDGTISDFTAEALRDIKGYRVPGFSERDSFSGARQDDPVDIPFSLRRGPASGDSGGRPVREADGSLRGLPRNVRAGDGFITASHWQPAEDVAIAYMKKAGLPYNPPSQYVKVNPDRARRIAEEYEKMRHNPEDKEVAAAYEALASETIEQYRSVMDSGLTVEFIPNGSDDPYAKSPRMATEDIRKNNHMWVFSTRDGFGTSGFDPGQSPMLAPTEFKISGQVALVNDLFRVVHDYFGHVKEGVGFRADGEENAWRAHSSMFTPQAQRALTTETRGQNSWVNYGPHGESNRKASGSDTVYADQKVGLLPTWVSEDGRHDSDVDLQATASESDSMKPISGGPPLSIKRATEGKNLIPKDVRDQMTSDGDGNYLFYHYGHSLEGGRVNPKYAGTGAGRHDQRNTNVSFYYTKPDERESMVHGDVYVVKVPAHKVYPFNRDPLNLLDKAEKMFRNDFGDYVSFDAHRQADYMGPLAAKAGFDIMVAKWSAFPVRGESTKALRWDKAATDMARSGPSSSVGGQKIQDIARALIANKYNTKAKAKAYLKEKGLDQISDAVIAEMGRIIELQREIRKRRASEPMKTTDIQSQINKDSGPQQADKFITVNERTALKDQIMAEARAARQATRDASLAGEIHGKAAGRKEGAREAAQEMSRQRDKFVKQVRLHLGSITNRLSQAAMNSIMARAVAVNPTNKTQVDRLLYYLYKKIDEANEAAATGAKETIIELTDPNRFKKTNESGIVKGKIDNRVRKLLATIHEAVKSMTQDQVSDAIDAIDAALFAPDANVELLEDQLEAYRIAYGALSNDPEVVASATEAVKQIIAEGRSSFRHTLSERHKRYVAMRASAVDAITGGGGVKGGFEEVAIEQKQSGWWSKMLDGIGSFLDMNEGFRTLLDKIDKSDRGGRPWGGALDAFYRKVADSRDKMNTRAISTLNEMRAKLEDIYGSRNAVGRAVSGNSNVKSLGNFVDMNGNNVEMMLSQNRAYYLYNLMKSPENDATFNEMGFTQEMKNAVVDFLTPEVKEWADWQTDVFYPAMYSAVNDVYKELNYIDLPKNKYFTPIRRVGVDDSAPIEVGKFQRSAAGVVNGSLKERTGSTKPFDLTTDGDSVLYQYVAQMNHYIAFAESVRDLNATFGSAEVRRAVSQNANGADNKIIERFIDALANDGRNRALSISLFDKLRGLHATAKLSLNMVVALKQMSAMPAYMTDLSPKDFAAGLLDFMTHPIEASSIIMESPYIQERYKTGFDRDMAIAMARDYHKAFSGKSTLMDRLMFNVRWGDKASVFSGGWAVYRYHFNNAKRRGLSDADAKKEGLREMEEATKMSQQSTGIEDLSDFQRVGSLGKLFTMYKTSPLAYFRQERKGIRDMARGLRTNDYQLAGDGFRRFVVYHFVLPAVFQFVSNALPGMLTEPDDDDDKDMLRAMALGSLNGIFIIGDILEFISEHAVGKPWAKDGPAVEVPIFKSVLDLLLKVSDVIDGWSYHDDQLTEDIMDATAQTIDLAGIPAQKTIKMTKNYRFLNEFWGDLTPGERAAMLIGFDPREIGDGYGGSMKNPDNQ